MFNEKELLVAEYLGLINDLENAGYLPEELRNLISIKNKNYKSPTYLMRFVAVKNLEINISNMKEVVEHSEEFKNRKIAIGGSIEKLFKDVLSLKEKMPRGFYLGEGTGTCREIKRRLEHLEKSRNKSKTIWQAVELRDKMLAYLTEEDKNTEKYVYESAKLPHFDLVKSEGSGCKTDINSLINNCIQLTGMNQWELSSEIGKGKHFIKNLREGKYSNNQMLVDEAVVSLQEVLAEAKKSSVIVACEEKNTEYLEQIKNLKLLNFKLSNKNAQLRYEIEAKDKQIASNVEIVNGLEADRNFAEKQRELAHNTIAEQSEIITGVRKDLSELKGQMLHKESIKTLWKLSTIGLSMILLTILCLHFISN